MKLISFRVLGPLEVAIGDQPVAIGGPKPRMLLAALLLQPGVVVSTDLLADVLWPAKAPRSAAANIRTYVHSLRRRLAEIDPVLAERIQSRASGYILTASAEELDHVQFETLVAAARQALDRGDPESALAQLDRADALWRGDVLEGLPHDHGWGSAVARLEASRLSQQELRLKVRIELGRCAEAIVELRGLVAEHPLREELWQQLIIALRATGRRAEALEAYDKIERILREELDARPGPRLRELRAKLAAAPSPPVPRPAQRFPICQLPLDLPDFTGRDRVVADLVAMLRSRRESGNPSVTVLSGAPGVGKSTIAVRVAHALRPEFPDGQLHLNLAGTSSAPRTPMSALAELLHALGVGDGAMPREESERSAMLRSRLSATRMCVVLDDAGSAAQVRPLLPGAGTCAVVITSRIRMPDLAGATAVDVDLLTETEATELLSGIIGPSRLAGEPGSAADILRHCGYLPLAIRVAGAKLTHRPSWTLRVLALRLRDERRRLDELRAGDLAVRASVALSYALLPEDAARAFRGLGSLGPVTFTGWVVAAVLGAPEAEAVLDTLVDAHLVELVGSDATGQPRYRLHDLLRVYAAEQGDPSERTAPVRRVLEAYVTLAVEAVERMPIQFFGIYRARAHTPGALPPDVDELLADPVAWFEAERQAGVAAVALAADAGFDDLAWRLASAMTPYFDLRGHHEDWLQTHVIALEAARRTEDLSGQAIVLRNLGQVQLYQDVYVEAMLSFSESRDLSEKIGDDRGTASALAGLGTVLRVRGDERALEHCHEALALFIKAGDRNGEAVVRIAVGMIWMSRRCYTVSGRWLTDALELSAEIGDRHREAHALNRLALLHQHRGNLAAAREHVNRAIAIFDELNDDHCVGYAHQNLGELCLHSGDLAHARLLLVNSLSVHRRNGDRRSEAEVSELLEQLHQALSQPERARTYAERAVKIWRDLGTLRVASA